MKKIICVLISAAFIVGCSTTLTLQNSIPYETQQLIKSVQTTSTINYKYVPNQAGEVLHTRRMYSINKSLEGMLKELIESKFNSVSESATNSIIVELEKVKADDDVGAWDV